MSTEDGLAKLFAEKIYTKDNAGMHFAVDIQRRELIFIGKTPKAVDEYISTSGYNDSYDKIVFGKVPENLGSGM